MDKIRLSIVHIAHTLTMIFSPRVRALRVPADVKDVRMKFLLNLSVAKKIFLIPIIGAASFLIFVVINSYISSQNAQQLGRR